MLWKGVVEINFVFLNKPTRKISWASPGPKDDDNDEYSEDVGGITYCT